MRYFDPSRLFWQDLAWQLSRGLIYNVVLSSRGKVKAHNPEFRGFGLLPLPAQKVFSEVWLAYFLGQSAAKSFCLLTAYDKRPGMSSGHPGEGESPTTTSNNQAQRFLCAAVPQYSDLFECGLVA